MWPGISYHTGVMGARLGLGVGRGPQGREHQRGASPGSEDLRTGTPVGFRGAPDAVGVWGGARAGPGVMEFWGPHPATHPCQHSEAHGASPPPITVVMTGFPSPRCHSGQREGKWPERGSAGLRLAPFPPRPHTMDAPDAPVKDGILFQQQVKFGKVGTGLRANGPAGNPPPS